MSRDEGIEQRGDRWLVRLTEAELDAAASGGKLRHLSALSRNLKDQHGKKGPGWREHIEGVAGEMAVSKLFNVFYDFSNLTFKTRADVAGRYQVRTRSKDWYDLIVRKNDSVSEDGTTSYPNDVYILVLGVAPELEVVGWTTAGEAKHDSLLRDYDGREKAYFVPQQHLHAVHLLCTPGSGLTLPGACRSLPGGGIYEATPYGLPRREKEKPAAQLAQELHAAVREYTSFRLMMQTCPVITAKQVAEALGRADKALAIMEAVL